MTTQPPSDTRIVVGASRGLGRGIAIALANAVARVRVVVAARSESRLADLAEQADNVQPEVADATDPVVATSLLDRYDPQALILVAGASPAMLPLQQQTWVAFSANWHTPKS